MLIQGWVNTCLQITTGVFLFIAVYKISKFMNKSGAFEDKIDRTNTQKLWLHCVSFGLVLFCEVTLNVAALRVKNKTVYTVEDFICLVFLDICSFAAEVILALILWQLSSTNTDRATESSHSTFPSIKVTEFDEHA
jgi:uncharacterized membrane protein